jgi:predicted nucleic acid-binding Zn ribbon protein
MYTSGLHSAQRELPLREPARSTRDSSPLQSLCEPDTVTMQHARTTLKKIFSEAVRREDDGGAVSAWPLACGPKVAERTTALSFSDSVLTVAVPDDAWRDQLQSFVPQYLAALNQMVAEPVGKIEFRIAQRQR